MQGYIWVNKAGQYLAISETHTHVGHKVCGYFVTDINDAYVGIIRTEIAYEKTIDFKELLRLPAVVERRVYIDIPTKE
jgi:hypothetical protein